MSNGNLTVELAYAPRKFFMPYHQRRERNAIIVAHRRCGKTVACIRDLEKSALQCENVRGRFGYIAPLYSQAKQIAWDYAKEGAYSLRQAGAAVKISESELKIVYPNKAELKLYGADNPDQLRGLYWDGVVLDEIADMRPDLYEVVIKPGLIDRGGRATMIGTPKGQDKFHEYWRRAITNEKEGWYSSMLKASETGVIPAEELAKLKLEMSPADFAREFECSFDEADSQQFISGMEVQAAQEREWSSKGVRVLGVDVARFGSDRTVILFRNGDVVEEVSTFQGLDAMQVVGRVAEAVRVFKPDGVFVDGSGLGAGVVDRLRQLRFNVIDVISSARAMDPLKFKNLRAEMWWKMRDWIRSTGTLPRDNMAIADDLMSAHYKFDASNRIVMESKDDMKKRGLPSPDAADALAFTFAMPVASPEVAARRSEQAEDYDPFKAFRSTSHDRRPDYAPDYDPFAR